MSFSHLNQGELTSLPPLLFPFLTMEHQLGVCGEIATLRLFLSAGAAAVWGKEISTEISEPLTKPAKHHS